MQNVKKMSNAFSKKTNCSLGNHSQVPKCIEDIDLIESNLDLEYNLLARISYKTQKGQSNPLTKRHRQYSLDEHTWIETIKTVHMEDAQNI